MFTKSLLRACGVAIAFSLLVSAPLSAEDAPKPSNHWMLIFDGAADNDGELVLHFAPATGDPVDITTRISKGTHENAAAELVAGSLAGQLGGGYKVKHEDGEQVHVKTKGKTPKFVLSETSSSVTGLKVKIKRK
ncbi:MAG TPA: hypothetical protein VFL16_09195 [Steroidobacteraceae bacterium]|jgi:hypothetical protein|nr:hypothetical protein [Steroidobacteraceae bacterium]